MRRKCKDTTSEGATHYGKAFDATCKLLEAETRLTEEVMSSATRKQLTKTVDAQNDKLERLTRRDRETTALISEYLRENGGKMGTYPHFADWCAGRGKLNDLDLRTIQYRLQNQYSAQGKRGRPAKSSRNI